MREQKKPEIVVFAGPNGSGKSTFTEILRPVMDYINADEIKKALECSDLEARYTKALRLVKEVVAVSDVCHIYDNSWRPFRIFKKRKTECWFDPMDGWSREDIIALTGVRDMRKADLHHRA